MRVQDKFLSFMRFFIVGCLYSYRQTSLVLHLILQFAFSASVFESYLEESGLKIYLLPHRKILGSAYLVFNILSITMLTQKC